VTLCVQSADIAIELNGIVGISLASTDPDLDRRFRDAAIASDQNLLDRNVLRTTRKCVLLKQADALAN